MGIGLCLFKMTDSDFPIHLHQSSLYTLVISSDIHEEQKLLSHRHKPACGTLSLSLAWSHLLAKMHESGGGQDRAGHGEDMSTQLQVGTVFIKRS